MKWSGLYKASEIKESFLIFISKQQAYIIPKRYFNSTGEQAELMRKFMSQTPKPKDYTKEWRSFGKRSRERWSNNAKVLDRYKVKKVAGYLGVLLLFYKGMHVSLLYAYLYRNGIYKIGQIKKIYYICCEKDLSFTKSVEASAFVQSERYFSQHMY